MRTLTCICGLTILAAGLSYGFSAGTADPDRNRNVEIPNIKKMTEGQLLAKVNTYLAPKKLKTPLAGNPELNARYPWIKEANVDVFQAGRWDSTDNYVSMKASTNGDTSGSYAASVAYFTFDPPTVGTFLIMTRFSGHQKTCRVKGSWGTASAFTANMGDDGLVIASFTTRTGDPIEFTMTFTTEPGEGIGAVWYGTEFVKFSP